jgi:1,5-anhydro-D-fructose reductase (1,5-anhydro-D-mannitol-forming)
MTIGWAMIGTGRIHKWMVPAIKEAEDTELVAVLSRDKARAAAFAKEHGIERSYDSLDELLRDPEIDVVYVASPNGLHALQTIKAAEAGKHVLCEKPMALTLEDCSSMIEACEKQGVKLGLSLQFRQHPAHFKAREIVASGELGQLVFANAQVEVPPEVIPGWYCEPEVAGGGAMHMVGGHRIDLLRLILECEVEEVSAFIGEQPAGRPYEDMVVGMLRFENGAYGTLHFSLNIAHGTNSLEVHGSRASLFCINTTSQWWGGGGDDELLLKGDVATARYQFPKPNLYRDEVEDFNRCIREGGEPLATGADGLRLAEISIALFESGHQGKTIRIAELRGLD